MDPLLTNKPGKQLTVVDCLEEAPKLWVFVFDRVEAMRTVRDELLLIESVRIPKLNIGFGQDLEEVLITAPSRRVAGTCFFFA